MGLAHLSITQCMREPAWITPLIAHLCFAYGGIFARCSCLALRSAPRGAMLRSIHGPAAQLGPYCWGVAKW